MSKLETLVTVLQVAETEKEIIDQLILNYYSKPNASVFETSNNNYRVLDQHEMESILEEIADQKFESVLEDMKGILYRKPYIYFQFLDLIDHYEATKLILEDLDKDDVAEYFEQEFIIEENGYFIFSS